MGAAGTANATDYLETDSNGDPWFWATEAECQSDAPVVWNDPNFDRAFPYWNCAPGDVAFTRSAPTVGRQFSRAQEGMPAAAFLRPAFRVEAFCEFGS